MLASFTNYWLSGAILAFTSYLMYVLKMAQVQVPDYVLPSTKDALGKIDLTSVNSHYKYALIVGTLTIFACLAQLFITFLRNKSGLVRSFFR